MEIVLKIHAISINLPNHGTFTKNRENIGSQMGNTKKHVKK